MKLDLKEAHIHTSSHSHRYVKHCLQKERERQIGRSKKEKEKRRLEKYDSDLNGTESENAFI